MAVRRAALPAAWVWRNTVMANSMRYQRRVRGHVRDQECGQRAERTKVTNGGTKVTRRPKPGIAGHRPCLPDQGHQRGGQGEKGHAMADHDDLPAEVRKQDEEAELQIAAQLAELRKDTEATDNDDLPAEVRRQDHDDLPAEVRRQDHDDLPAEVRRQDEEAELQIAAQLAELRKDTEGSGT